MRPRGVLALLGLPAVSAANAAMASSGLMIFGMQMWLWYVLATVVVEAVLMGWWLKLPAKRSIGASVLANFMTGILGVLLMCSAFIGSVTIPESFHNWNPDPLAVALRAMLVYGLFSAVIEAAIWARARTRDTRAQWRVVPKSIAVHIASALIGLGVLLIPEHPYQVLAGYTDIHRTYNLRNAFRDYVSAYEAIPRGKTMEEAIRSLGPFRNYLGADPNVQWTAGYVADWKRFDRGEMRRRPREWNQAIAGKSVQDIPKGGVWIARWPGTRLVWDGSEVKVEWSD
jgi:hypothetical protein